MSGVTPKPSSSVLPRSNSPSPPQQTNSSVQQNSSNSSGSPTGPGPSAAAAGGSGRITGHSRIASTSTTNSRPEGYPSWLPRRPPPPAPASTFQSRPSTAAEGRFASESPIPMGDDELSPSELDYALHAMAIDAGLESEPRQSIDDPQGSRRRRRHPGSSSTHPSAVAASYRQNHERKPTPRSVRILGDGHNYATAPLRDLSDSTTRVPTASSPAFRAFSRATGTNASATIFHSSYPSRNSHGGPYPIAMPISQPTRPPRFRTPKFHPTLLVSPSKWTRLRFMLWGVFVVFGHLILQSFLDFNVAFMLVQIAKHPTPSVISTLSLSSSPSDNSSSSRNWTLATVAYITCWVIWVFGVWLCYEVVYCFWRRWRVKRPLLMPIYLSTPAFNLVSLTSYTNFCFLNHVRWSALTLWDDHHSSVSGSIYDEQIEEGWQEVEAGSKTQSAKGEETTGSANEAEDEDGSSVGHEVAEPEKVVTRTRGGVTHRRLPSQMSSDYGRPRISELSSEGRPPISELETQSERPISSVASGIVIDSEGKPQVSELESSSNDAREKKQEPSGSRSIVEHDPNRPSSTVPFPTQASANGAKNGNGNGNGNGVAQSTTTSVNRTSFKDLNIRQFLAESCWFYSQNTPTVSLLIPRLALSLALLLAYNGPAPAAAVLRAGGEAAFGRDGTFFEPRGELSTYAKVIIWLNVIWGAWRILVLVSSWMGLWVFSGLGCAGICGPRYRWEEPGADEDEDENPIPTGGEKRQSLSVGRSGSVYNPRLSQVTIFDPRFSNRSGRQIFSDPDDHTLNWEWMISARERVWDVWEFCTTGSSTTVTSTGAGFGGGNTAWRKTQFGSGIDPEVFAYRNAGGYSGFPMNDPSKRPMMSQVGRPVVTIPSPMHSQQYSSSPSGYTATTATATGTLLNTPIFFPPSAGTGLGFSGMFPGGYAPLDQTVLSTLQEVASNPSLAAGSSVAGAGSREQTSPASAVVTGNGAPTSMPTPLTAPATPLPIFTTPAAPRRGVLTSDLFIDPTTSTNPALPAIPITVAPVKSRSAEGAWAASGKSGIPGADPAAGPVKNLPYPFPSFSSTSPPPTRPTSSGGPPASLPFPLTVTSSHTPNVIPTPATTVHSLPFPTPQSTLNTGTQASPVQPTQPSRQSQYIESYDDDFAMSEHDSAVNDPEEGEDRAHSVGTATGSMSSLGQPIQSRYPFGYRRPRGRGSSFSGSAVTSGSASHSGSGSAGIGQQQLSPKGSSVMSGSGNGSVSGSGYGTNAVVRGRGSRSTRFSAVSVESGAMQGGLDYEDYGEVILGDDGSMSSLGGPGMAGVGAGGGMGPRASLVNVAGISAADSRRNISPPPAHPRRRRAGTMPSPTAHGFVPPPQQPPLPQQVGADIPRSSGSFRARVASVPNPPSPASRAFFAPVPMYGGPGSYDGHGHDSDDEPDGSQEAAEREDSVGLLSAAPSPRGSLMNLRIRGSNVSLNRRAGGSRPVSLTSSSSSSGNSRSRTGSLVAPVVTGRRGSSPNPVPVPSPSHRNRTGSLIREHQIAQVARSRADSGAEGSSHYSDARVRARTDSGNDSNSSGARRTPEDLTFGVQVNWRFGQDDSFTEPPPIVLRGAPSNISDSERNAPQFIDEDPTIHPVAGPSTVTSPLPIPQAGEASQVDLSSANASFVTANPSLYPDSTTETMGRSVGGSSGGTWNRGTSNRYFAEGSGMYGPR